MLRDVILWLCALAVAPSAIASLEYGRYEVGTRTVETSDAGRVISVNGTAVRRPMFIRLWYPAKEGGVPATLNAYFMEPEIGEASSHPVALETEYLAGFVDQDPLRLGDRLEAFLELPIIARRDAPPVKGPFPAVIIAHTEAYRKSVLAEYLASHGFVVLTSPVVGTYRGALDIAMSGIETQARDIEFLVDYASSLENVDDTGMNLVGISFGAMSVLRVAMANPSIDTVVSLDGGIGSSSNVEGFGFEFGAYHDPTRLTTPILHLFGTRVPGTDLGYLRRLHYSSRAMIGFDELDHSAFGGDALLRERAGADDESRGATSSCVMRLTLEFLERRSQTQPVSTKCGDFEPDVVEIIDADPVPPSVDELLSMVDKESIEALEALVAEFRETGKASIPNDSFTALVGRLVRESRLDPALSVAELQVSLFPESMRAHYNVAVVARRNGDSDLARRYYVKAIELRCDDSTLPTPARSRVADRARSALEELDADGAP